MPATASAPAGSAMVRLSSKMSWIAAQISSVLTRITSSTYFCARRKVSSPTRRTATPSAKMPTRSSVTRVPAAQRVVHAGGVLRLDADDAHLRVERLHVGRDAGDQPAAADRHEDRVERPGVLAQDLHADRALPGDHVRVVERVDEREPALAGQLDRVLVGVVEVVAVQHHLAAEVAHGLHLDLRRGLRHHDHRRDAAPARRRAPRPGRGCRPTRRSRRGARRSPERCAILL